jgi:hypothetical protein
MVRFSKLGLVLTMRRLFCLFGAVLLWICPGGYGRADLLDGLIGYWPFDETSGTVAHCLVNGSDDGQLFNFPDDDSQWVTGQIAGALQFRGPGPNDYVIVPHYDQPNDSVSFSGWVIADVNTVSWQSIIKNWGDTQRGQFHFGLDANSSRLGLFITQTNGAQIGPAEDLDPFPTGIWVHVGLVVDASRGTLEVYRDGALVASGSHDGTLLQSPVGSLGIGIKTDDSGTQPDFFNPGYWQGSFDDFGLWNRALTADDMAYIFSLGLDGVSFYDNP